jgi:hypothetical protein
MVQKGDSVKKCESGELYGIYCWRNVWTWFVNNKCSCVTPPEDGFLEAETYLGVFKRFKET